MTDPLNYYVAGIIDGEGTITLASGSNSKSRMRVPTISVSSTTIELLEFLKKRYGGSISKHKTYQAHHKQSWSWKLVYNKAIDLCNDIHPLLLEPKKRERAKMLASDYKLCTKRNGRYTAQEESVKLDFERRFFEI